MVVVFAKFCQFFVIATQTCDVAGQDKPAQPYVIILPVRTLQDICRSEPLMFKGNNQTQTIEAYLSEKTGNAVLQQATDASQYGMLMRKLFEEWQPSDKDGQMNRSRIGNFITKVMSSGSHVYYLPAEAEFGIPDLCVDFCSVYTVRTQQLLELASSRIARIADPYRDQFAQKFSDKIGRIAVPEPLTPRL